MITLTPDEVFDSTPTLRHKAEELTEAYIEKGLVVRAGEPSPEVPKAWYVNPYSMQDSIGMGYRTAPSAIGYETLRAMAEREPITASIIKLRVTQGRSFAKPQPNKYSIGYVVRSRDYKQRKTTTEDHQNIKRLERLIQNCGRIYNRDRDSFSDFVAKFFRDSLTYDQACAETPRSPWGNIVSFHAAPSESFRIAKPKHKKGTPLALQEVRNSIKYVQVVDGVKEGEYTADELIFGVRNARTDMRVAGYGMAESETAFRIITAMLWGVEWNIKSFSQGATAKGMLNFKGNIPTERFEAFKRQWMLQTAGVSNAWKTPMINTEEVQWIPLQLSNSEMGYSQWLEFLIKVLTAIYQCDPAELNFDMRGGTGAAAPAFVTTNEAQQKLSKDRGLRPLLEFLEDKINRFVIWPENDNYEFAFVGLDAKTEEQAIELRLKQIQFKTLNEVRAEDGLPPVPHGDVILNPTYTGYVLQKDAQQQGQPGQGGPPGQPPPEEAYDKKFQGAPHGDEEAAAGKRLEEEAESKEQGGITGDRSIETGMDDWESTVHAALDDMDLYKSMLCTSCKKHKATTRLFDGRGARVCKKCLRALDKNPDGSKVHKAEKKERFILGDEW